MRALKEWVYLYSLPSYCEDCTEIAVYYDESSGEIVEICQSI